MKHFCNDDAIARRWLPRCEMCEINSYFWFCCWCFFFFRCLVSILHIMIFHFFFHFAQLFDVKRFICSVSTHICTYIKFDSYKALTCVCSVTKRELRVNLHAFINIICYCLCRKIQKKTTTKQKKKKKKTYDFCKQLFYA